MTKPYLLGALHDGVVRHKTCRIVQKSSEYIEFIKNGIHEIGHNAWSYREGKNRNLYVVEFSKSLLNGLEINSRQDKIDYIRGYFDAEGGLAQAHHVRYYVYFAQKNLQDLMQIRDYLEDLKIKCGIIHNPSKNVDPNYWRFYIRSQSYIDFAKIVGSWHPVKSQYLRMKI